MKFSQNIFQTLTIPNGAGPGTPRMVLGSSIPDSMNPITNADPPAGVFIGNRAIAMMQIFGTGLDFEFIAFMVIAGGPSIVFGHAAGSNTGDLITINQVCEFAPGVGAFNGFYNTIEVADGTLAAVDRGTMGVTRSSIPIGGHGDSSGTPLFINFLDSASVFRTNYPPFMGQPVRIGNGSSQGSTGTDTFLQIFGVGTAANQIQNYPVFSGLTYRFEGQFTFNGTASGSGLVFQIHKQVGGSPAPATDPVLVTAEGAVGTGTTSTNMTIGFNQPYQPAANARETYYASIFGFGAGVITVVSTNWGSATGVTNWSIRDCGRLV